MILMGDGSKLYYWKSAGDRSASWQLVADCAGAGIRDISRIDVSPGGEYIAIVAITQPPGK